MATKTIIDTGTPEELAERLKRRAPSMSRQRYRLIVQPEPNRDQAADALEAIFRDLDDLPDPATDGKSETEVSRYVQDVIAAVRGSERTKPAT